MSTVPVLTLNNGVEIPQLGFGTFQIEPPDTAQAVMEALDVGYRHVDTAQMYGNEAEVGDGVRASGLDRSDVFITSKLSNKNHAPHDVHDSFNTTLEQLGFEYLDLFLVHWPLPGVGDYVETWRAMEELVGDRCRAIGVSNFQAHHLDALFDAGLTVPAVNQIEVHPYMAQSMMRDFDAEHGIVTEAWSPIAQGKVLEDRDLISLAERVGRTPAQVVLRWHLQRGDVIFPKSTHKERMEENFALFDFELGDEDMAAIDELNRDERIGPDPDEFDMVPD